jgi:hypothetical protein
MADSYVPPSNQTAVPSQSAFSNGVDSLLQDGLGAAGSFFHKVGDLFGDGASMFSGSPSRVQPGTFDNRNLSLGQNSDPETAIANSIDSTVGVATLQYPTDLAPYHMSFQFSTYTRPDPLNPSKINPIQTIILPMPDGSGINDNQGFGWDSQNFGLIGNAVENMGMIEDLVKAAGNLSSAESKDLIMSQTTDVGLYALDAAAKFLGTKIGVGENLARVGEQLFSATPNPSLSTFFSGLGFRQFSFTWTFAPKDEKESVLIRRIINAFKVNSLPTFSSGGSLIFNYPLIVKPEYSLNSDPNKSGYITDFKNCAIKDILVRYSPQGEAPSFYAKTNAPVFISMTINLSEIEYQLGDSYGGTRQSQRGDVRDVNSRVTTGITDKLGVIADTFNPANIAKTAQQNADAAAAEKAKIAAADAAKAKAAGKPPVPPVPPTAVPPNANKQNYPDEAFNN